MAGMSSTMASVRGSRRIWMNSFRTIGQTRLNSMSAYRTEGSIDRHPRLQCAVGVLDGDLDPEDQVQAVALGLDVARRELCPLVDCGDRTLECLARKRIGRDAHGLAELDLSDIPFQHIHRKLQIGQVRDSND